MKIQWNGLEEATTTWPKVEVQRKMPTKEAAFRKSKLARSIWQGAILIIVYLDYDLFL